MEPANEGNAYVLIVRRTAATNPILSIKTPSCIPSMIRMKSSTRRPRARIIPTITRRLKVYPMAHKTAVAPNNVTGTENAATRASRQVSITMSTIKTASMACQPFVKPRFSSSRITSASSPRLLTSTPGSQAFFRCMSETAFLALSTSRFVSLPGALKIWTTTTLT